MNNNVFSFTYVKQQTSIEACRHCKAKKAPRITLFKMHYANKLYIMLILKSEKNYFLFI